MQITKAQATGLEKSTRPLVFMSASGCRASEIFDISSEIYFFPYVAIFFVMQGECLFSDISRPGPACVSSQSDQCICNSLFAKYTVKPVLSGHSKR